MIEVHRHDTLDSTNEEAKRLLGRGAVRGAVCVVAREQTDGKGTRGRRWSSPRDAGIYLSYVRAFARGAAGPTTVYTLAAGVACAEAIEARTGLDVRLKPVNDLWAGGGKLGGILTETSVAGADLTALVVGVGVNVCAAHREVRDGAPPTCLETLLGPERFRHLDRPRLEAALLTGLASWIDRAVAGDEDVVRTAFDRRCLPAARSSAG